jgi:hypothetical protein
LAFFIAFFSSSSEAGTTRPGDFRPFGDPSGRTWALTWQQSVIVSSNSAEHAVVAWNAGKELIAHRSRAIADFILRNSQSAFRNDPVSVMGD